MHYPIRNIRIIFISAISLYFLSYLGTLPLDLIDIDSSQYGEIVREMWESREYTRISDNGRKYLDKPILTFWIILPFFKLLGVGNVSFRLPYLLFTILSTVGIFHIVILRFKNEFQAWVASLAYLASPGVFNMVLDPKIDLFLTNFLIFTHWFYYLGKYKTPKYFYFMYLSIGLGFITKGPISLVIPGLSIGLDLFLRRDWELLKKLQIVPGVFVVAFFPALWSYFLYQEFSTYGPAFFLWIQSFGRFYKDLYDTGLNPFYFYTTFLWSSGVAGLGILVLGLSYGIQKLKPIQPKLSFSTISSILQNLSRSKEDFVFPLWLFLYLFLISFSRYQLPQYVFWSLPASAVIFSKLFVDFLNQEELHPQPIRKGLKILFSFLPIFLFLMIGILIFFYFEPSRWWWEFSYPVGAFLGVLFLAWFGKPHLEKEWILGLGGFVVVFFPISYSIYPDLTRYQPAKEMGASIQEQEPNAKVLYTYRVSNSYRSFAFYSQRIFRNVYDKDQFRTILQKENKRLVLLPEKFYEEFQNFLGRDLQYKVILRKPYAKIATPKKELFLESKRESVFTYYILVEVSF